MKIAFVIRNMKIKFTPFLMSIVAFLSISVYAGDGDIVDMKTPTKSKGLMAIGACSFLSSQDINGNTIQSYSLPVTTCVKYKYYKAKQVGSGWNTKYEELKNYPASYKNEIVMETKTFTSPISINPKSDELMINTLSIKYDLQKQCNEARSNLMELTQVNECK